MRNRIWYSIRVRFFYLNIFHHGDFTIGSLKKLSPDFISRVTKFQQKDIILVSQILGNQKLVYQ